MMQRDKVIGDESKSVQSPLDMEGFRSVRMSLLNSPELQNEPLAFRIRDSQGANTQRNSLHMNIVRL